MTQEEGKTPPTQTQEVKPEVKTQDAQAKTEPLKPSEKQTNCPACNKPLKRVKWYYRNEKYYCNKKCWRDFKNKAKEE